MQLLSIVSSHDGRKLKQICQGLIKSGACSRILVSNYVHSYTAGEGKGLNKTQHKLVQIHVDNSAKLTTMLDKLMDGRKIDHWVCDISTL